MVHLIEIFLLRIPIEKLKRQALKTYLVLPQKAEPKTPCSRSFYLDSKKDFLEAFGSNTNLAISHYVNFWFSEGFNINSFDEFRYIESNIDLMRTFVINNAAATFHYVQTGYSAGEATDTFDKWGYLDSNID